MLVLPSIITQYSFLTDTLHSFHRWNGVPRKSVTVQISVDICLASWYYNFTQDSLNADQADRGHTLGTTFLEVLESPADLSDNEDLKWSFQTNFKQTSVRRSKKRITKKAGMCVPVDSPDLIQIIRGMWDKSRINIELGLSPPPAPHLNTRMRVGC